MNQELLMQVMQQLQAAATSDDPTTAAAWCTEAGWQSRADSGRRLVRSMSQGEVFRAIGPCFVTGDPRRAALRCEMLREGRDPDTAWWLFEETTDGWKLEGFSQNRTMIGLYLEGVLSPVISADELPSDEALQDFANAHVQGLNDGSIAMPDNMARCTSAVLESAGWLAALHRGMAVVEYREEDKNYGTSRAVIVAGGADSLHVLQASAIPGWQALLDGVVVDWTIDPNAATASERLSALMDQVLGKGLAALGLGQDLPAGSGERLMQLLEAQPGSDAPPFFDASAMNAAWGDDMEARVTQRVQVAVGSYLMEHGVNPSLVDPDTPEGDAIMQEHGAEVVRILFASILASVGTHAVPEASDAPSVPAIGRWVRAAMRATPGEA